MNHIVFIVALVGFVAASVGIVYFTNKEESKRDEALRNQRWWVKQHLFNN